MLLSKDLRERERQPGGRRGEISVASSLRTFNLPTKKNYKRVFCKPRDTHPITESKNIMKREAIFIEKIIVKEVSIEEGYPSHRYQTTEMPPVLVHSKNKRESMYGAECTITSRVVPVADILNYKTNVRAYICYSEEVEKRLGIPINTIIKQNGYLKKMDKNHRTDKAFKDTVIHAYLELVKKLKTLGWWGKFLFVLNPSKHLEKLKTKLIKEWSP